MYVLNIIGLFRSALLPLKKGSYTNAKQTVYRFLGVWPRLSSAARTLNRVAELFSPDFTSTAKGKTEKKSSDKTCIFVLLIGFSLLG